MTDKTPAGSAAPKRTPAAKTTDAKAPARPAARTPETKATLARMAPAAADATTTVPPVEPVPATTAPAAMAPAGWYPVAAGSPQQRWWDGARWTEHVYGPTTPSVQASVVGSTPAAALRAPEGVKPGTAWFWLLAVGAPVLALLELIPTSIYLSQLMAGAATNPASIAANEFSPAYLLVALSGWFIYAVCIVFGWLDWRELKARGIPKPFHWAWSFFVLAVGWPAVYVIGRTVIVKRRTGSGMAPLWVFIGLQVVTFVVTIVVVVAAIVQFVNVFNNAFATSGNGF